MAFHALDRAALAVRRDQTLGTIMERLAKINGRRQLVEESDGGLRLTYAQASKRVNRWAGGIAAQTQPGDRVVIATRNGYEMLLLSLAASRAGAIPVPAAARLVLTEGNYLLLDSGRWPAVAPLLDEVWFCALRDDVRLERLLARHVAFGKPPDVARAWVASVDEPNAALIEATRARADLVVPSAVLETMGGPPPGA